MEVKQFIIHKLEKQSGFNAKKTERKAPVAITQLHADFMSQVKDVYYKKSNPIYGVFDSAAASYPYQTFLDSYLKGNLAFSAFTSKALGHFEKIINEVTQATGGYVLFCHFITTEDFMAVIVLNDKESYLVGDDLDLKSDFSLDIEKLDVANFSNCAKWNNNEDVYLSFTRGKKDVSNYFKKFIGCTDYTSAKESSEKLKKALSDFLIGQGLDKERIEAIKSEVFTYCEQRMKNKEDISLNTVSSIVNQDDPELFKEFAASEAYEVSSVFKGHATLKSLRYYSFKSQELTIVFDSKLLDHKVIFDAGSNELLIKEVPEKLRAQLNRQAPAAETNE
ncbi:nucleoid-associated protein [Mucilaginibacter polytrichastri]|uniref:Nucleoid-associated protein n=1 Tax=Mucilaginibacter polytrichastri TaxID=1302689 RepID=A0A1Q5ZS30_9SPHI|nr:nucleoid-associated protein [Mucilaginibacter polytrichastri]OKS84557.1 hypothetical protein RG47T_5247 [Mucilaginibacter polytrichastri]SFT23961.1 hypothetical protein SAMN04487890_12161 [Mucilaginibacter polytrichastri]